VIDTVALSLFNLNAVITDGREEHSAKKLVLPQHSIWIWCCVHILSLVFEDSFDSFLQNERENIPQFLVSLRKLVNFLITNFDKLAQHLPVPDGFVTVSI
jgi:hypothetical protein